MPAMCSLTWLKWSIISIFFSLTNLLVAQAPCNNNLAEPTEICQTAPVVCELENYCNTMPVSVTPVPATICGTAISLDNPHWFSFIATANSVSITILPTNCLAGGGGAIGLQGAIVLICPSPFGGFFETVGSCQASPCSTDEFTIGVGGIYEIGRQYWIMLDGCAGSVCDYQIVATEGVTAPALDDPHFIVGSTEVCPGGSAAFTVDEPRLGRSFQWEINGEPISSGGRTLFWDVPSGTAPGVYEVCLMNASNLCYDLVEDNGYDPGSICTEVEIVAIPETVVGPITICADKGPYAIDGHYIFPPVEEYSYLLQTEKNCDSIIRLVLDWVDYEPEEEIYYICEGELPLYHPVLGPIAEIGTHFYPYEAQSNQCDSSFFVTIRELIFDVDVRVPRFDLQCPGQIIRADASNSKVILMPENEELYNVFYSWFRNGNQVGNSPFLDITSAGTYTFRMVVAEYGAVCFKEFTFTIREFFDAPEKPVIEGPRTVCKGSVLDFVVPNWDPASTILWQFGGCYDVMSRVQNRVQILFDSACVDSLCVLVHKKDCPILSQRTCISIRVQDELQPQITGNGYFCPGDTTSLEATPGYQVYRWTGPNNFSSSQRVIRVGAPGIYQLIVEDNNACSGFAQIAVQEKPFPNLDIAGSLSFCPGGQTQLFAVPSNYPNYIWSNGSSSSSITLGAAGNITLQVFDEFGCTTSRSVQITQQDSLTPVIGGDLDFCDGGSTILNGGNGYVSYIWNGVNGPNTFLADRTQEVRLRVVDAFGCVGTTRVMVSENPNPVASIDAAKLSICPGEDLILQSNPAAMTLYQWSDGYIGRFRSVNTSGDFKLTVTDANGCTGISEISIGTFTPPNPQVEGDIYFCQGEQANIRIIGNYSSYKWSDNNLNQTRPVTISGRYGVTVTDGNGCTGETFYDVEEKPNPLPQIQGDDAFCAGASTVLTLTESYNSYSWSGSGSGGSDRYLVTMSGNYFVEVTDIFGCRGSSNFIVTVYPNPIPQISGSTSYCIGLSTTLDAGNYAKYQWVGPGGFTQTTRSVSINTPGNYSVTVTDVNGCTGVSNIAVIEESELSVSIENPGSYCQGSAARLSVLGNYASYLWSTGAISKDIDVTSGIYTVTVTDATGCTGSQTAMVTENLNPIPVINGPSTFCKGRNAQLDAGQWVSYVWSNGLGSGQTATVNATGTFSVTVTDVNGCSGSSSFSIRELDRLEPTINGSPFFCAGENTILVVESGYQRYAWLDNGSSSPQRIFNTPGTFTFEVEDSQGCTGTGQITVIEHPLPIADAGEDKYLICERKETVIGGIGSSTGAVSYQWRSLNDGMLLGTPTSTITVNKIGLYELVVQFTATGCKQLDTTRVSQDANIIQNVLFDIQDPSCHNDTDGRINIASIIGGTQPFRVYLGGEEIFAGSAGSLSPGNYSVLVRDDNGCTWQKNITIQNPPPVSVDAGPDLVLEWGDLLEVSPTSNISLQQISRVQWSFGSNIICDPCLDNVLKDEPTADGIYTVLLESVRGCLASDSMRVTLRRTRRVFIPSAFTPNRDGINDRFTIYGGKDVANIKKLEVFDRWGNQMFLGENLPPNNQQYGWEGNFRDMPMDPAIFIYAVEVEFEDGEVFLWQGEVTLLR